MKKYLLLLYSTFYILNCTFSQTPGEWTWMNGTNLVNNGTGVFGTKGVPAAANTPASFYEAVDWTDTAGNFWLCGGYCSGVYADVWKFDPVINQWAWINGSALTNQAPVYGTMGVPAAANN